MNQKLITVLLVSVFCYGVTYSSPLSLQNEDVRLPEEKPPTDPRPATEHINKKIETNSTVISPSNQNVNTSKTLNISQTVKDPALALNSTEHNQRATEEALNENTKSKSISSVKVSSESSASTSVPTNNASAALPTAASTVVNSSTAVPAPPTTIIKNNSTNTSAKKISNNTTSSESISTSTISSSSSSSSTTTTTTTTTSTTTTTTTMKPSVTTSSTVSTNKDNVVEHNTPAPIQEKHFDGQSFIGGMALTIGLTAIGFIAFKYYKSGKIDINYRTF